MKNELISVDNGRPVADAVHELMKRHPVVITYEDLRYTYAGHLADCRHTRRAGAATSRRSDAGGPSVWKRRATFLYRPIA
jgi:hypothetical protein